MHDHDQRFKPRLKTFLPEFFALFCTDRAEIFNFSQVEWLECHTSGSSQTDPGRAVRYVRVRVDAEEVRNFIAEEIS